MPKPNEYAAFSAAAPSTGDLASLSAQATELYQAELAVVSAEAALKEAQRQVQDLSERVIPGIMEELGLKELTLKNGAKLKVEKVLTVSPLKANRDAVLDWLEETGNGGKIKRSMTVALGKDEERAVELTEALAEQGFADVSVEKWVEPQTLKAHVKAVLVAGGEVDMDLLGAREFDRAKITDRPKGESAFGE